MSFPDGASGKEPACQCKRHRYTSSIPRLGRSPGRGHGNPLQYSYLENPMDRRAWWVIAHRVTKSQARPKQLSMHAPTYPQQRLKITCATTKTWGS